MSIAHPDSYDFHTAGLHGLGVMHGGDEEVLRDLGIPVDEADLDRHLASAEEVRKVLGQHIGTVISERDEWKDSLHLTHPSTEGPLRRATPEQRAQTSQHIASLKNLL